MNDESNGQVMNDLCRVGSLIPTVVVVVVVVDNIIIILSNQAITQISITL